MEQNWTIHQLERKSDNGFVVNVHWRFSMTDTDETGKYYYADTYSVASYTQDEESEDYIPFEELTQEIVVEWVKETLGEEQLESMEASLVQQIESQKNPPIVYGLPWEQGVEVVEESAEDLDEEEEDIDDSDEEKE